jgi:outer membrane protein assembly factor BamA
VINAEYVNPTLNNFFGMGNNSVRDPSRPLSYYRTRYKDVDIEALFRRKYFGKLQVMLGPKLYYYWNKYTDNAERILGKPAEVGLDSASIYGRKLYIGGKLRFYFDNLNNELFPTRGVQWNMDFTALQPLNNNSHPLTKLESNLSVYASLSDPAKLVAVIRVGGGHIFSQNFEYFQAMTMGSNNWLRGFRKTRFYGNSLFYNSVELRIKLMTVTSYLLPGDFGVVLFNDVGRVWLRGESSGRWHDAYGGGLYLVPFKLVIVSATVGFSKEETALLNLSIGAKLNLTF